MKRLAAIITCLLLCGCTQQAPQTNVPLAANPKPEIEKAVRAFVTENQTRRTIEGLSYKRYDDSIYLIGIKFEGVEGRALNLVARKYDGAGWKIEQYSDQWRSILRMEPD